MAIDRTDVEFVSGDIVCRAWRYRPSVANGACIVMAHGLGGLRSASLDAYAQRFAEAGFAVLLFDYRHFGASSGEPRQRVSVRRQLADWAAAVAYARAIPGVDANRVALWGTSFSGGHVVVTAARDARVAALCAQGPMMDGLSASLNIVRYAGLGQLLRLAARGLADAVRALTGRERLRVPLVAAPGALATMSTPDAEPGYRAIVGPDWVNGICASFALGLAFYRPVAVARRVRCPALIIVANDSVAPATAAVRSAKRIGAQCELHEFAMGHFDIYLGEGFERGVTLQTEFLLRTLSQSASERANQMSTAPMESAMAALVPH